MQTISLRYHILPLITALFFSALLNQASAQSCTLSAPQNVTVTNVTPCGVTIKWNKLIGADKYKLKYQKSGSASWISYSTKDTSYNFTGLSAGIKYTFSVQGKCPAGGNGTPTKIKKTTASCALPTSVTKTVVNNYEEKISVTSSCSFDSVYCYYGTQSNSLNSVASSISSDVTLSNLQPGTTYYFKVSTCPLAQNNFTLVDSFKLGGTRPNIILIVLDDARFDQYSCNGAPSFMHTPNIDRIANEGINFKNSFVVHSECAPARATIATGDYTSRHGVYDNLHPQLLNPNLPLLPSILHQNGYYTALVGKNHLIYTYSKGYFDYWLEYVETTGLNQHTFNYEGTDKEIDGYGTNIMTDTMMSVLDKATEPYFIQLAYTAPHAPLLPADEYANTFTNQPIILGPDTPKYTINYPSYMYTLSGGALGSTTEARTNWREILEMLLSVDDGVGEIFSKLEAKNELDNTMIIFTSDNGHLIGEHYLDAKRFAYDPSMRVPLFIRYPEWFSTGSIDTSNLVLNVDYAPTILHAAGIPDTFNMDGKSLEQFYEGTDSRNTMYYHYWYSSEGTWHLMPPIYAVRDKHYVLIDYGCKSDTTEEFFDLINDSLELTNLINNHLYSSLIQSYRTTLSNMKVEYGDTATDKQLNCYLANPVFNKQETEITSPDFSVFPNPASDYFTVRNTTDQTLYFALTGELGQPIQQFSIDAEKSATLHAPTTGIYFLSEDSPDMRKIVKLVFQ